MTQPVDDDHREHDGFERVHVENDWYDGPRSGLADVGGQPHYFQAVDSYHHPDEPDDEYFVWPASSAALACERQQWAIFVEWNTRFEAGTASVETHPGHGGVNARYDELTAQLAQHRAMPTDARRFAAEWHWLPADRTTRYHLDGPDYLVKWRSPQQQSTTTV